MLDCWMARNSDLKVWYFELNRTQGPCLSATSIFKKLKTMKKLQGIPCHQLCVRVILLPLPNTELCMPTPSMNTLLYNPYSFASAFCRSFAGSLKSLQMYRGLQRSEIYLPQIFWDICMFGSSFIVQESERNLKLPVQGSKAGQSRLPQTQHTR